MSATTTSYKNFVGGDWVDAASGETMEVVNPATGETIGEVPSCGAADVDRAVEAAKKALPDWLDATPKERSELLHKLADVLDEHGEELAQLESLNVGKPLMASRDEMPFSADNLRFFAGAARHLEGQSAGEYIKGYTSIIRREPLGIVGGICPWNYPLMMAVWKMGPALAAGNVQILKPSEQTPLSLLRFVQLAQEVIPAGVLQVVTGDGVPVGERLVAHPDVRLVSLTGDVSTGKRHRPQRGGHAQARPPRAGRQGADGRLRRRRPEGGRRGHPARRLLELRPGLHGRLARDRRPEDLRQAAGGARAPGRVAEGRRPDGERRDRDGLRHLEGAAGADPRLPRAGQGRDRPHGRRHERKQQGLLRPADGRHRREADGRDRPGRGLRPGRDRAALRGRRRGDPLGQRRPLRARRRPSGRATSAAR